MKNGKIVVTIHPFVFGQEITAYVGDECVQVIECTIENIPQSVYQLCEKYNIDEVHFWGGQFYSKKFKDEFIANKYGNKKINVYIH